MFFFIFKLTVVVNKQCTDDTDNAHKNTTNSTDKNNDIPNNEPTILTITPKKNTI